MAKTCPTNPHGEEPPRRSNRTARKSPASFDVPARKATAARKTTAVLNDIAAHNNTAARKDTAASPSVDSDNVIGERKGPPEAIVPAPEAIAAVPRLPTLWEWPPPSDVGGNKEAPEAIVPAQEDTMQTMVAHDFAADLDVAFSTRRTLRHAPGSNNNGAGEEGKHDGGEYYDDGYASDETVDDDRDGDFVPKGLESSDEDDDFDHLLCDDDIDEEDRRIEKMDSKSRIPTGRRRGNLIQGGPVAPNYELMSASEASDARIEYQSLRKAYRDGVRKDRLRGNKGTSFCDAEYTGDLTPTLRPMALVLSARLQVGHTFPESSLVKLRVAEEANHRGIYFSLHKSDEMRLVCKGDGFFVQASNSDMGWTITKCEVLVQQGDQPLREITTSKSLPRSPYKVSYILPLIAKTIAETPMASNKILRQVLEPFGREYCFTDAIIQGARTEARRMLFGDADDNVAYVHFVKEDLEKAGHHVELSFTTRKDTLKNLDKIILAEEAQRRKDASIDGIIPADRKAFVLQWRKEHASQIYERLGTPADELRLKFLNGIFFAPSFAKQTVPLLQKVYMADACHLNFGKYTLFSCYGVTANSNASPVAFAIIFGNESTNTWRQFWKYALELHPCIDSGEITIITDQDKGQKNAITQYLKSVGHFHCSYHRRQNITKMCGGGGGKLPNSALWMYNKLMKCKNVEQLQYNKDKHFPNMSNKDINYLNSLDDESQYPAARCAMGLCVYLYFRSSSGVAESMNNANKEIRARTAVDLLNACILLTKLEVNRYYKMKTEVWGGSSILTPRGIEEYEATFTNLHPKHFSFQLKDIDDYMEVRVKRINVPGKREEVVTLPKYPVNGSYFGTCTCGATQTDAVPCEHMSVVALSAIIRPQISPMNIMPIWWKRSQWRLQFPLDTCPEAKITMKTVKDGRLPDYSLRLCPDWTTGSKPGRPKKGERIKSGLETAMAKGKKGGTTKTKATKRRRCDVCGAYGHIYEECFLLEKSEEIENSGMKVLPIEEIVISDDDVAYGCEAPL